MATHAKVRRMYYRERLLIVEIARRTSLSRKTIKRWLREPARDAKSYPVDLPYHARLIPICRGYFRLWRWTRPAPERSDARPRGCMRDFKSKVMPAGIRR